MAVYDAREFSAKTACYVNDAAPKLVIGVALCCASAFLCSPALAQKSGKSDADAGTSSADEEVIVVGQRPAQLRLEVQHAEEAVYDRFNAINSSDEFDIHCRRERLTGSHLLRRICEPNFWRTAQAQAGAETTRGLQGSAYAIDSQTFLAEAQHKRQVMAKEMRRLAKTDKELGQDLVHLVNLERAMDVSMRQGSPRTASSEETAGKQTLPYGAALDAEVRIGHKPWRHALTQRTFTFAHVYGNIRRVDIKCDGHKQRLQFEAGVEWTLPDKWKACALRVEAPAGTTFSLYEFQ